MHFFATSSATRPIMGNHRYWMFITNDLNSFETRLLLGTKALEGAENPVLLKGTASAVPQTMCFQYGFSH
jgi:hypothetical protein